MELHCKKTRLVRLSILCLALVAAQIVINAQDPAALNEPRKIDEFGDICCDAEMARLTNYLIELQNDPTTQGYVIYYGGRFYDSCWYGGKRHGKRRPRRGEAKARAARLLPYLIEQRGLDPSRIALVQGGYRESWTAELWIVPAGAKPPAATPTVQEKDIKYRKGAVAPREFYHQCRYPGDLPNRN
jgi:hypothetical protein